MYKLEIHSTFRRIIALLYEFGFWQNDEALTFCKVAISKWIYSFNMILFQIIIATCTMWISTDKNESIFLVQVELLALVMMVKLIFLLRNKAIILLFLSDTIVTHNFTDYEVFVQVKKKLRKFMKFVHAYIALMALIVVVLIVSPLPMFSSDKKLPMFIVYSLNWKYNEHIYWIIYIPLVLQIFIIFAINLLTVIIWYVMLNCSIKYQILGNKLMNLGVPKTPTTGTTTTTTIEVYSIALPEYDSFHQEFVESIELHRKIIEYMAYCKIS